MPLERYTFQLSTQQFSLTILGPSEMIMIIQRDGVDGNQTQSNDTVDCPDARQLDF